MQAGGDYTGLLSGMTGMMRKNTDDIVKKRCFSCRDWDVFVFRKNIMSVDINILSCILLK